ncbi:MAG: glycosyltransferase [Candidatus Bathyarchaeota archaeon]|nr:glycosyltransferase [Candidatus Bathyarchaeota archaeon]
MKVVKVREFTYPTYVGGIEICLHRLCPALAKLGVGLILLTCAGRGLPRREVRDGVEVRRIDLLGMVGALTGRLKASGMLYGVIVRILFLLVLPIHMVKVLKEFSVDLIHVHCLCALSALPASIVSLLTGTPLVITMHGTFLGYYGRAVKPPFSWIIPAAEVAYLRLGLYDRILVEDRYTYRMLIGIGVAGGKVSILPYPGVELEKFRDAHPIEGLVGRTIVLHHGRLVGKRGVENLIRAIPEVVKEYPGVRFMIAGEGPEEERLRKLTEDLGVASYVTFLGLVPYELIPRLVKSSTIVVVPSLVEGHSSSVVEAMAAGKPVIATRVGGIVEVVRDGVTGVLVDPGDPGGIAEAIIKLLGDGSLARSLGMKAAESVRGYDVRNLAEKEFNVYRDIVEGRRRGFRGRVNLVRLSILLTVFSIQILYMLRFLGNLAYRLVNLHEHLLYGWVILSACLLWFILKYKDIADAMVDTGGIVARRIYAMAGFTLCIASLIAELVYRVEDFFYAVALSSLVISGVFLVFGSLTPLMISIAYVAGVGLPLLIDRFAYHPISEFAARATATTLSILGYEASVHGSCIAISTFAGSVIEACIDPVCAGSTSLSVFVCLFMLVTMDLNLKLNRKIAVLFVAGCLGVIGQAILRLILIGIVGVNYGFEAFFIAHRYLGYILFPLYFTLFIYVYLKATAKIRRIAGGVGTVVGDQAEG